MTGAGRASGTPAANPPDPALEGLGRSGARRELTPAEARRMAEKVRQVELAISLVLRVGVVASVLVVAVGLGLMFAHHGSYLALRGPLSYRALTSASTSFPHSFATLGHALARGEGRGVVVLGVLILILTPVLRVAVGVVSFAYEKDTPMTLVTLFVLVVLVGSFFLAGA
ncbi:MAG TPA: DUF1634 domain-containing protein [Acidimicrobiales bacterium]|nr:MAG: hypothetical protein B7Z69_00045 [Actinobacteria bacterium 21-73-9]HQU27131.1 DUF1634 domain-containing protein [Acidimicrobiales bacterium]